MRKFAKAAAAVTTALSTLAIGATRVAAKTSSSGDAAVSAISCVAIICGSVLGLGLLGFTIWMIIDVNKRDEKVLPKKMMWMLLMIIGTVSGMGFGWLVAIYYYFARKRKLDAMTKK
jgi:hypothetical protein